MTAITAKRITLAILHPASGVRYVVLKNRVPVIGREDTGYVFNSRMEAITFAAARYHRDFAILAITESGSIDMTPQ